MKLQKILSGIGIASRRKIEKLIISKQVTVNRNTICKPESIISPKKDEIMIQGKKIDISRLTINARKHYFILNKPAGFITTTKDDLKRKTVFDLIKEKDRHKIFPVGRLDCDTIGAIILTNDGEMAYGLTHPKFEIEKIYKAKVRGWPSDQELNKIRKGIYLEDGPTGPNKIEVEKKTDRNTWIKITLTKGKNRQIKRMFWRINHPVQRLTRTHFAGISINNIKIGAYRKLTIAEVNDIKSKYSEKISC